MHIEYNEIKQYYVIIIYRVIVLKYRIMHIYIHNRMGQQMATAIFIKPSPYLAKIDNNMF